MRRQGFTLVELLVGAVILGVLLSALGAFLVSNLRVTDRQMSAVDAHLAVRLGLLRIGEVVAHAHYIFPAGQTVTLTDADSGSTRTFTTGHGALALLVPAGTTYCDPAGTTQAYCGFLYSVEDRAAYAAYLAATAQTSGRALVEWRVEGIGWERNTLPTSVASVWGAASARPLVDSVAPASGDPAATSLAAAANLAGASSRPPYDDRVFSADPTSTAAADSLVQSVGTRIVVSVEGRQATRLGRSSFVFSRAIPRGAQPNPD